MTSRPAAGSVATTAFDVLAEPRRRYLLSVLLDRAGRPSSSPSSIPLETLATDLASRHLGHPIVTDDQRSRTLTALVHVHLPRLECLGVVAREDRGGEIAISLAAHPIHDLEWVRSLLADPTGGTIDVEDALDRTLEAFRHPRRRVVCEELARRRDAVPVAELATVVAARDRGGRTRLTDVTESDRECVATDLLHVHLPQLAAAGLVERDDRSDETVALVADAPQWGADWLAESPLGVIPDLLGPSPGRSRTADDGPWADVPCTGSCWTIEGAENVIARGHALADGAEEELFVTMPDDGLIQRRCLERWHAAAERGVDVTVGSRSRRLRERVREAVPRATVCEPRFDWLNLPTDRVQHGRLILADRARVMLVTVDDDAPGSAPRATAITGEGPNNALVSLVCEQVCPRLDRLDAVAACEESDGATTLPM